MREFYRQIVATHPDGVPEGRDKQLLWPLLTPRLIAVLENTRACERDYFRKHPDPNSKAGFWWSEQGLFSGSEEESAPAEVKQITTRSIAPRHFHVTVEFTYKDTFETYGRPPDPNAHFSWRGVVTVDCSSGRCLIDDFTHSDWHHPMSQMIASECRGGLWIGRR